VVSLVGHDAIYHFALVIARHEYQNVVFPDTSGLWCDGTVMTNLCNSASDH
jgi:hypothetical protein